MNAEVGRIVSHLVRTAYGGSGLHRRRWGMELQQLGSTTYACVQEDRGLGWSNSGLVAGGGGLVIDTLYDPTLTRQMADLYATVTAAAPAQLVNTHHNGDHCWGNQVFAGAEIIAHAECIKRFDEFLPETAVSLAASVDSLPEHLRYLGEAFGEFDFDQVELTWPTTSIDGDHTLVVGDQQVEVLYVGPAHTAGDVIVHVPDEGVVFAGDVLFYQCTPIGWEGSFASWIDALARIEALEPEWVVPGHGPVCGVEGPAALREYLEHVLDACREHHAAGRAPIDAARRIELGRWQGWNEPYRLAFQVHRAYKELDGGAWDEPYDTGAAMADLATLRAEWAS